MNDETNEKRECTERQTYPDFESIALTFRLARAREVLIAQRGVDTSSSELLRQLVDVGVQSSNLDGGGEENRTGCCELDGANDRK